MNVVDLPNGSDAIYGEPAFRIRFCFEGPYILDGVKLHLIFVTADHLYLSRDREHHNVTLINTLILEEPTGGERRA